MHGHGAVVLELTMTLATPSLLDGEDMHLMARMSLGASQVSDLSLDTPNSRRVAV
jgi:hypothetical protein